MESNAGGAIAAERFSHVAQEDPFGPGWAAPKRMLTHWGRLLKRLGGKLKGFAPCFANMPLAVEDSLGIPRRAMQYLASPKARKPESASHLATT